MSNKNSSWSYTSSQGYSIEEDAYCRFRIKKNGEILATSFTPYPILNKVLSEKWLTLVEVLEIATILQIPEKFIDSSLSELEEK